MPKKAGEGMSEKKLCPFKASVPNVPANPNVYVSLKVPLPECDEENCGVYFVDQCSIRAIAEGVQHMVFPTAMSGGKEKNNG